MIRPATTDDLPALRDIERAAGESFRVIGMPEIADDEPLPVPVLAAYADAGRAWVVADPEPVAYLIADVLDGHLHIEQVSVHPKAARLALGRALIEHAAGHARTLGLAGLTLTTFADVAWNAPYYRRCGFTDIADADLGDGLRAVTREEAAHGLTRWPRVAMRRPL